MSENEKNPNSGEPISEEQLDDVSGGSIFNEGTVSNPKKSGCWFRADGEPREDGRTRCRSECKGILDSDGKPVNAIEGYFDTWYICSCWGSGFCVDKWHKPCYQPARTAW